LNFALLENPISTRLADVPGRRTLRSTATNLLAVPFFELSTILGRAFPVAAAKIWNALPDNVVLVPSLDSFRRQLKTFVLNRCRSNEI